MCCCLVVSAHRVGVMSSERTLAHSRITFTSTHQPSSVAIDACERIMRHNETLAHSVGRLLGTPDWGVVQVALHSIAKQDAVSRFEAAPYGVGTDTQSLRFGTVRCAAGSAALCTLFTTLSPLSPNRA